MLLKEMNKKIDTKKINHIMETRFGFSIDFDKLTFKNAVELAQGITEGLNEIKRSTKIHSAEKNPQYMEMLMVRESLHRWMLQNEKKLVLEGELAKAEANLAAKDMVDSIQDMLEKLSKMQNEQMPALVDAIRDQIGADKADAFKAAIAPVLKNLYDSLTTGREGADNAARALAGEQTVPQTGDLAVQAGNDVSQEAGTTVGGSEDTFAATDAAAGGTAELGRERR